MDITELVDRFGGLEEAAREHEIQQSVVWLKTDRALNENRRIECVRILLALLPDFLDALHDLLSRFEGRASYEVHFSIFCFLDEVGEHPHLPRFTHEIASLAEQYLRNVPKEIAKASWMAGHFLGAHWEDGALDALFSVARCGTYAAGRRGAVVGLQHQLVHAKGPSRRQIVGELRRLSDNDRGENVRVAAGLAIGDDSDGI